ncbi:MAG: peptidyl-prolyl cis-trans isomerase [Janthinobacterium lividum]
MLALFRGFMNTWPARLLILVMVAALGAWGIAGVFTGGGVGGNDVATVDGRGIRAEDFDRQVRHDLEQVGGQFGSPDQIPPGLRRMVAQQTLNRLVVQEAVQARAARMDLSVPDDALRDAVFAIPAFHGANGSFDRTVMNAALGRAGLSEARFLQLMRDDMTQRELVEALKSGMSAPGSLVGHIFAFEGETRVAQTVSFPLAGVAEPAAPAMAVLQRWYANHPEDFRTPELRRIKAVVISPDTVARSIDVTDAQLQAAYDAKSAQFHQAEKRSVDVVTAADKGRAETLATLWRGGVPWTGVQAAATQKGTGAGAAAPATTVSLDDATEDQIPSPELAKAVFAAKAGEVVGPVQGSLGWVVLKVSKVTPPVSEDFAQAKEGLRTEVARELAAGQVDARVSRLQDALAGGTSLDELPGDLGAAAVQGTLDAQGRTAAGEPAPLPGDAALHDAVVKQAFAQKVGDAAQVVQGPGQSAFALVVEAVTPPSPKPYAEVADAVLADWRADEVRHGREAAAARLLAAVQGGQSIETAAAVEGAKVGTTPPIGRQAPPKGVPGVLAQVVFTLKQGEATMVEDAAGEAGGGFVVAVLQTVTPATQAGDPIGYGQMRDALSRGMGDDAEITYASALRALAKPRINQAVLDRVAEQP